MTLKNSNFQKLWRKNTEFSQISINVDRQNNISTIYDHKNQNVDNFDKFFPKKKKKNFTNFDFKKSKFSEIMT